MAVIHATPAGPKRRIYKRRRVQRCLGAVGAARSGKGAERGEWVTALRRVFSASLAAKGVGLLREVAVARTFGIQGAVDAYSYAVIVPGFCIATVGGVSGPMHSSVAAVLGRAQKEEEGEEETNVQPLVEVLATYAGLLFTGIALFTFASAPNIVRMLCPGLKAARFASAVEQLRIMTPVIAVSGVLGVGSGALSVTKSYAAPALCPIISSLSLLATAMAYDKEVAMHATALATATTIGALGQWIWTMLWMRKASIGRLLRARLIVPGAENRVRQASALLVPALFSMALLPLTSITDMYFISSIPGAGAALSYAGILAMAPIGILSSTILVPCLPRLSRAAAERGPLQEQAADSGPDEFEYILGDTLVTGFIAGGLIAAILAPLALPAVSFLFEHKNFDSASSVVVASLVTMFACGSPFILMREVLVRTYYSLNDARTPLVLSVLALGFNFVLDFVAAKYTANVVVGVVGATVLVNVFSCGGFLVALGKKHCCGRSVRRTVLSCSAVAAAAIFASIITSRTFSISRLFFHDILRLTLPGSPLASSLQSLASLGLSSATGLAAYAILIAALYRLRDDNNNRILVT